MPSPHPHGKCPEISIGPLLYYLAYLQPHLGTETQVPWWFFYSVTACGTDSIQTGLKTNEDHQSLRIIYSAPGTWEPSTCSALWPRTANKAKTHLLLLHAGRSLGDRRICFAIKCPHITTNTLVPWALWPKALLSTIFLPMLPLLHRLPWWLRG